MQRGLHEIVRIFWHESMVLLFMLFYTENEGTRVSPFGWKLFFGNGELFKVTLQFHKNCQKISKMMQFFSKYTYSVGFLLCDEQCLALADDSRKISKFSKLRKRRRFFWKYWKWILSKRSPLNFFIFFCGLSIIWTTYSLSLDSRKQYLPVEKNIFQKKITIVHFFKNYRRKELIFRTYGYFLKKTLQQATSITERDKLFWSVVVDKPYEVFQNPDTLPFPE